MTSLVSLTGIGIAILICIAIYAPLLLYFLYFPKTNKFRVAEKTIGSITYYHSEVYRFLFGWSGFNASKYSGTIWKSSSWTDDKLYCEENIIVYKKLKNIE